VAIWLIIPGGAPRRAGRWPWSSSVLQRCRSADPVSQPNERHRSTVLGGLPRAALRHAQREPMGVPCNPPADGPDRRCRTEPGPSQPAVRVAINAGASADQADRSSPRQQRPPPDPRRGRSHPHP